MVVVEIALSKSRPTVSAGRRGATLSVAVGAAAAVQIPVLKGLELDPFLKLAGLELEARAWNSAAVLRRQATSAKRQAAVAVLQSLAPGATAMLMATVNNRLQVLTERGQVDARAACTFSLRTFVNILHPIPG